ncbi:MAG: PilZ domain-containing protein [Acidobacteriota bacterium]
MTKNPTPKERRKKPRIDGPFPATLRAVDAQGEPFEIETELANLSASGIYFSIPKLMNPGSRIHAFIEVKSRKGSTVRLAAHGVVVRIDQKRDGANGFAAKLTKHRFF